MDYGIRSGKSLSLGMPKALDVEHPTVIPMDLPRSHQAPRGPMTRARARALETEVTSFLSDISFDPLETWLLPKSGMLCMIRYQEDPPEDAREEGQAPKSMEEEKQWEKARTPSRHQTSGQDPGHPAPGDLHGQASAEEATGTEHPAHLTGNLTKIPNICHQRPESTEGCLVSPDIRRLPN